VVGQTCTALDADPPERTARVLITWDRLPACHCLHDVGSEMLMITVPLLLKPDRLEAYPTCLGSVDHAQTDRDHKLHDRLPKSV